MRTNAERNYETDVYSDLGTSYSATHFLPDAQEFSLEQVREKLGNLTAVEENATGADYMPSQQTLTMSFQRDYQSNAATKTSTKIKVASICYAVVVMVLVLGIALTSVAVNGLFSQAVAVTADYKEVVSQISAMEEQLATEDVAALAQRAEELGYIKADQSNTQTYTEVETRPAQNFNIETNWFDSLCDWFSGVFGG